MNYFHFFIKEDGIIKKKEAFFLIIVIIIAATFILWGKFHGRPEDELYLYITSNSTTLAVIPMNENYEEIISAADGYNIVQLVDGRASVTEADCANQICVHSQEISQAGQTIACLPHKLLLEIKQGNDHE